MCLAETKSERDRAHQYKNCLTKTLASISRTHGEGTKEENYLAEGWREQKGLPIRNGYFSEQSF